MCIIVWSSHVCSCDLVYFFCSSRRRHTRCALGTGVQTCALPISPAGAIPPRKRDPEQPACLLPHRGVERGGEIGANRNHRPTGIFGNAGQNAPTAQCADSQADFIILGQAGFIERRPTPRPPDPTPAGSPHPPTPPPPPAPRPPPPPAPT